MDEEGGEEEEKVVGEEVDPDAEEEAAPPPDPEQDWAKMWYKNHNAFGIREKHLGKRQVMTVRSHGAVVRSRSFLEKYADVAIKHLRRGWTYEQTKEWIQNNCK